MARALVVDDDPLTRAGMARLCRRMGLDVSTAENGEDALKQLRAQHADVVLLDLLMPELDGFGVLEALKQKPILPRPAVILVTGAADVHGRLRGSELGALDFVEKPTRVEDLERRVRHALAVVELEAHLAEAQGTLEAMRHTDGATGAGSFAQLYGVLEAQFRAAELARKSLSCVLIADEGFPRCLAERGRGEGDARLRTAAQIIEAGIRVTDFLFRVDAAEFVVLAPATDAESAQTLVEALRSQLLASKAISAEELATAVATYPHPDIRQAGMLYRAANVALARARLRPESGVAAYR